MCAREYVHAWPCTTHLARGCVGVWVCGCVGVGLWACERVSV
jgi:hypothetical protein